MHVHMMGQSKLNTWDPSWTVHLEWQRRYLDTSWTNKYMCQPRTLRAFASATFHWYVGDKYWDRKLSRDACYIALKKRLNSRAYNYSFLILNAFHLSFYSYLFGRHFPAIPYTRKRADVSSRCCIPPHIRGIFLTNIIIEFFQQCFAYFV